MTLSHAPAVSAADPRTEAVIRDIGMILEEHGMPRIAGLVFGLLLVEGAPVSLHEMTERLAISRASASTNARLLAARGLIRRTSRPAERQDYYQIVAHPFMSMLETVSKGMTDAADALAAAATRLPENRADARERVEALSYVHSLSARFVSEWADTLAQSERPGAPDKDAP